MTHIPLKIHEDIPRADDCSNPKSWRVNLYQTLDLANMSHVFIYLAQKSCKSKCVKQDIQRILFKEGN